MLGTFVIRRMTISDLSAVDVVQRDAYREEFHEDPRVFADKLQEFPDGCWVCSIAGEMAGYMFSHPARLVAPPGLNALLDKSMEPDDCYFIHDIAVLSTHRRRGVARTLLERGLQVAEQHAKDVVALISVQGSKEYWERFGFRVLSGPRDVLNYVQQSYGESAHYMARGPTSPP